MLQSLSMLHQCWLHPLQLTQKYTHAVLDRPRRRMLSCYVSQEVDILGPGSSGMWWDRTFFFFFRVFCDVRDGGSEGRRRLHGSIWDLDTFCLPACVKCANVLMFGAKGIYFIDALRKCVVPAARPHGLQQIQGCMS